MGGVDARGFINGWGAIVVLGAWQRCNVLLGALQRCNVLLGALQRCKAPSKTLLVYGGVSTHVVLH